MNTENDVIIIDYGLGNLGSVLNMMKKVGARAKITSDPEEIKKGNKLVLPGVGSFDKGMENLASYGLIPVLNDLVINKKITILGICLGMQLFTRRSEEGKLPGLAWIDAETIRFKYGAEKGLRVPHMGWNYVKAIKDQNLSRSLGDEARFYFVHSYHVNCFDERDILMKSFYGREFVSAIRRDNIIATQFHPEKSHRYGMDLFKWFVEGI